MKEVKFERAALAQQPSPLQLSPGGTLSILTRSQHEFHVMDVLKSRITEVDVNLTNELENLVLYNEDIRISTNIGEHSVTQMVWAGPWLVVVTSSLNCMVLRRDKLALNGYSMVWNVNRYLMDQLGVNRQNIMKFDDLTRLRIHCVATPRFDPFGSPPMAHCIMVGTENSSVTVLDVESRSIMCPEYPVGDKNTVLKLSWSNWVDNVSYLSVVLDDNSVIVLRIELTQGQLQIVSQELIIPRSKSLISVIGWCGHTLAVVSTDKLTIFTQDTLQTAAIGTIYAITDICFLSPKRLILINGLNYLGVFQTTPLKSECVINYNLSESIETLTQFPHLRKKLLNWNEKYEKISIRGMVTDPLGKTFFIGFMDASHPPEYRRIRSLQFRVRQIPICSNISRQEIEKIDFTNLSPRFLVNLNQCGVKPDFEVGDLFKDLKFSEIKYQKELPSMIETNVSLNCHQLGLLQFLNQWQQHVSDLGLDCNLQILRFWGSIVVKYIKESDMIPQNMYDLAILQSYQLILGIEGELDKIKLPIQQGKLIESFDFTTQDTDQIVSQENQIPFKRCSITLLPLTDLNNLQDEFMDHCVFMNLARMSSDQVGPITKLVLDKNCEKNVYSGDYLYVVY